MTIESEIKNWLAENLSEEKKWAQEANIDRDRKIILEYYGFGSTAYPTYEELGELFSAGERQNVGPIISKKFRNLVSLDDFQGVRALSKFVMQTDFLPVSDLRDWLVRSGLGTRASSIRGLMRLAKEMGGVRDREIYTHTLERLTGRERLYEDSVYFVLSGGERKRLVKLWRKARDAPGRHGLCRIEWIREIGENKEDAEKVIKLIHSHPDVLEVKHVDVSWYCIEGLRNKLVNDCKKVFSLIERSEVGELSVNLRNAMNAHTATIEYPPVEVVEQWIRKSKVFSENEGTVLFKEATSGLSDSESLIVEFLKQREASTSAEIENYLVARGINSQYNAAKVIRTSPFISVDRSGGRKNFVFRLIGQDSSSGDLESEEGERYLQFKKRLEKFLGKGTDSDTMASRRNEQETLREWLFGDSSESRCAICGRLFSIGALRAAHKKKRSGCTEEERVDPHIVFPVCVFGCDYLYEERYLQVVGGKVKASKAAKEGTAEHEMILELDGRDIPEQWLKGPSEYFKRDGAS